MLCIVAGTCGVYCGIIEGGAAACVGATSVVMGRSRHLRRYYVAGRQGDGSVWDLAQRGIDLPASSVSGVLESPASVSGVLRVLDVAPEAIASFGM